MFLNAPKFQITLKMSSISASRNAMRFFIIVATRQLVLIVHTTSHLLCVKTWTWNKRSGDSNEAFELRSNESLDDKAGELKYQSVLIPGETIARLHINNLDAEDMEVAGFDCVVSNIYGSTSMTLALEGVYLIFFTSLFLKLFQLTHVYALSNYARCSAHTRARPVFPS